MAQDDLLLEEPAPKKADAKKSAGGGDDLLLEEPAPKKGGGDDLLLEEKPMKKSGGGDDLLLDAPAEKKSGGDDLLLDGPPVKKTDKPEKAEGDKADDSLDGKTPDEIHAEALANKLYPSATQCAGCHPTHYKQWSISQHAYAQMSPVFNAFHGKILKLTNGTNGDFCIRCHTPVGMNLDEPIFMSNIDRNPTSREGVTCIVCHRVNQTYGKISGRLPIVKGDLTKAVFGPTGDSEGIKAVIDRNAATAETDGYGRKIHGEAEHYFEITTPKFCGTCHDVTLVNGFRLEEAYSEYLNSPAAKKGVTCQDCHMGKNPGVFTGDPKTNYDHGPAAIVGSKPTEPRKLTNHMFVGPDYSVLHPALFPQDAAAIREESDKDDPTAPGLATIREWLTFDWKAGWGTDEFEDNVPEGYKFPDRWKTIDDRYDGRAIIDKSLKLLKYAEEQRLLLLQNGYKLIEPEVVTASNKRIEFTSGIANGTDGHGVPTGFDAERLVWLYVVVKDKDGRVVHQSGDLDPNGDVRDSHSLYVHDGKLPLDRQLLTLQSRFLTLNVRGGEREQVIAINYSLNPLVFLRPPRRSNILTGDPGGARKHRMGIEPGGKRMAEYFFEGDNLADGAPYTATIELKAAMVPVNLIDAIQDVGFDYNMSPREVADGVVAGHQVVWTKQLKINVPGK